VATPRSWNIAFGPAFGGNPVFYLGARDVNESYGLDLTVASPGPFRSDHLRGVSACGNTLRLTLPRGVYLKPTNFRIDLLSSKAVC